MVLVLAPVVCVPLWTPLPHKKSVSSGTDIPLSPIKAPPPPLLACGAVVSVMSSGKPHHLQGKAVHQVLPSLVQAERSIATHRPAVALDIVQPLQLVFHGLRCNTCVVGAVRIGAVLRHE